MSARVLLTIEYIAAARSPPGIAAGEQPIASAAELLMHYNRLETSNYRFSGEGARVSWRCRGLSDPGLSVSVAPFSPRGGAVSALKGLGSLTRRRRYRFRLPAERRTGRRERRGRGWRGEGDGCTR